MKKRNIVIISATGLILMLVISALMELGSLTKRETVSMGTRVNILVKDHNAEQANAAITDAFAEINRISDKYSTYKDDNLMAMLNTSGDTLNVDDETYYLLEQCGKYHKMTDKCFDPAVGNILRSMGFEGGEKEELPSPEKIREELKETGWKHVHLFSDNRVFIDTGVTLSFGAIAKGYAVDRAAEILTDAGIEKFLINAGGEIKAVGDDWKIGIQHPREKDHLMNRLVLKDIGIATSGDYEKFVEDKKGKRYSHIMNPVTGHPADRCRSVSVISDKVIDADALATGIFVMGPKKGMKLIEKTKGTEGVIVSIDGDVLQSTGFEKYINN